MEAFVKICLNSLKILLKELPKFNDIIEKMNLEVKKPLKPGQTQCLSLQLTVERILELWEPLVKYLQN